MWRDFGIDEKKLETVHYRGLCKAIIKEVNETDRNWRNGNHKDFKEKCDSIYLGSGVVGKDWIVDFDYNYQIWDQEKTITFRSRMNVVAQRRVVVPAGSSVVTNTEIVVVWNMKNIKILDTNGQLICEVPELDIDERISWKLASCCISGDQMAVLSQTDGQEKLSLWDVSVPSKVTRLNSQHINLDFQLFETSYRHNEQPNLHFSMEMDDQFIVVSTYQKTTNFYFFSKKTLDLHWQKTVDENVKFNFFYGEGTLVVYVTQGIYEEFGLIEMYDVKSGRFIRELRVSVNERFGYFYNRVGLNSKFMVIAGWCEYQESFGYKFNIYDLETIKNKNSADDLLVYTLHGRTYCQEDDSCLSSLDLMMDESEIFCFGGAQINIFNFGSLESFRNEAKSVTLSLPWRSVWRSKGVDEEPLEPVHHMEVYTEVLKYFHELTMNCQTASKTRSINNVDLATFTLGDDFIGFRRHRPEIVMYDENIDESCQETNCQIVQISQTAHLSVMGKTIQFIHNTTGKFIKETKLKREVEDWHFNCNLLVCVHKIAEHEHLLRVWKLENSLNLNHIKDVAITDYDGSLQVYEMFIAVETCSDENTGTKSYNFISLKKFQVERSLSSRAKYFAYDKGHLFLQNKNFIRILDVSSGTYLRDIHMEQHEPDSMFLCANSRYVVILSCNKLYSKLSVYDLKCLKETDTVPSHLLLTSFDLDWIVKKVAMNETRIVCLDSNKMYVVDLKHIDLLRCPEYNE